MILYFPGWIAQQSVVQQSSQYFLRLLRKNNCCSEDQIDEKANESSGRMTGNLVRNLVDCTFIVGEKIRRNGSWLQRPKELAKLA